MNASALLPEQDIVDPVRLTFLEWLRKVGGVAVKVRPHLAKVQELCPDISIDEDVFCYKLDQQLKFVSLTGMRDFDIDQAGLEQPSEADLWQFFQEVFFRGDEPLAVLSATRNDQSAARRRKKRTTTDRSPGRRSVSISLRR